VKTPVAAFTLLEVLLVCGVLAVLAALIVPAVQSAQARADSAKCLGHLRSLGVSLSGYLADHQMNFPPMAAGRSDWREDIPVLDTVLAPYVEDPRVFLCPADREIGARSGTSYYYNLALAGQPSSSLSFLMVADAPTRIPVLLDKEGWHRRNTSPVNYLYADGSAGAELRLFTE
jgi:prepilin-type processing-associated H-X9-DG protein